MKDSSDELSSFLICRGEKPSLLQCHCPMSPRQSLRYHGIPSLRPLRRGAVGCVRGGGGAGGSPLLMLVTSQLLMGAWLALYYAVAIYRPDRNVRRTHIPLYYGFRCCWRRGACHRRRCGGLHGAVGRRPPGGPCRH